MLYKGLGKRIKQQRILAKMTQEKLAEKVGISLSFLGHIERGTRKASLDTLVKISNALEVSPDLLLQDSLTDDRLNLQGVPAPQQRMLQEIRNVIVQYNPGYSDSED